MKGMTSTANAMLYTFVVLISPTNANNLTNPGLSVSQPFITPTTVAVSTVASHVCKDTIDNCRFFGKAPCTEKVYEAWSKAHCSKFCGFCTTDESTHTDCQNKLPNCDEFDDGTLCTADSYYAWAYEYCRGYCKFDQCNDSCHDQENFDCQSVNIALNICTDKAKAIRVCPKYCNICPVNGRWSKWTAWAGCSVTCGNGTNSRSRVCNNPLPANGGLSCNGADTQLEHCTMQLCPVHGGWGSWGNWSSCSVSCDTGLQNRHRLCDSPRPARQGDHCFGGESEYQICTQEQCAVHGGWGNWGTWSSCSVSCGTGLQNRHRMCDNPRPAKQGDHCIGSTSDYQLCSPGKCSVVLMSAFTVKNPQEATVGSDLAFSTVVLNKGSHYNTNTGHFICSSPGIYFFTLSLTKIRSSDDSINDMVYCYIRKNSNNEVEAKVDPNDGNADAGSYGTTASATLELAMGDVVSVGGCSRSSTMESWSLFSGFLVSPST